MFFRTACKIALREVRAAPAKFVFVVLAVAIGVAALSGVKGFGYAFKGMLLKNAKQLIGADVQGQVWALPTPGQLNEVDVLGRKYGQATQVTETISMAASSRQKVPQMIAVKAVDPAAYPFYGRLTTDPRAPFLLCYATTPLLLSPRSCY